MSELPFSTLLREKNLKSNNRWYPHSIDAYTKAFIIDSHIPASSALLRNIAYNMQYIEFLEKEFEELDVSTVIYTMLVKNYVITAMSILEGIFSNIVKSNGWWKMTDMESLGVTTANEKKFGDEKYIVKTELLRKIEPEPLQMNLDEFIKILSRHHKALEINHEVYPALQRLKNLRNKIHIQKVSHDTDHDYNAFDYTVLQEMRKILYDILSSEKVCKNKYVIEFLNK
ncbi:MAG: hypothetical protein IJ644_10400 [Oscillospiraceae bacterium]|nr:hypothetical protein [Oscillospiraceae bacterium]